MVLLLFFLLWGCETSWADTAADKGKELYLSYGCALCHGREGDGHGINGQKFEPPPTNFREPGGYKHGRDSSSLRRSIQYGIKEDKSVMPAFDDIPPKELDQIIAFLQSLQKSHP
jgi:mono/diheme cytochrome c family protein